MLGDLSGLPTTGAAWSYVKGQADATWPAPDLCNQDNKTGVQALATGMVYARIGGGAYRTKVGSAIAAMMASQRDGCTNAALAAGRQLGAWVLAADLVGYRTAAFDAFLADMRTRNLGGHGRWVSLDYTCGDSSNNWGAFACAALATMDRYLGRSLDTAWARFRGFTGDRGAYVYRTPSVSPGWVCGTAWTPIQVCPGDDRDGAPAEDAHRSGDYPTISRTYVQETMQGLALTAEMLQRAGYPAWDRLRPLAAFASRWDVWNASSVGYHVPWWYNARLGTTAPTQAAGYGRTFGFTDWWH